ACVVWTECRTHNRARMSAQLGLGLARRTGPHDRESVSAGRCDKLPIRTEAGGLYRSSMRKQLRALRTGAGIPETRSTIPAGGDTADITTPECPRNWLTACSDNTSHTCAERSALEVTTSAPSGLNRAPVTAPVWPRNSAMR